MPVTPVVDQDCLVLEFRGETADPEIETLLAELTRAPDPPRPWRLLVDVRQSSSLGQRSPEKIRSLVEIMARFREHFGGRFAVLVGEDVQFGLARMASAFADPTALEIRAFRDEAEARTWLGSGATAS